MCREEYVHNPDNIQSIITNLKLSKAHAKGEEGGRFVGGFEGSYNQSENYWEQGSYGSWGASGASGGGRRIVQVAPQRLNLKLRASNIRNKTGWTKF